MGGGAKDGMASLQRVRAFFAARPELRPPPVVILSGETDLKEHARYLEKGAARVVLKPANQEALRGLRALACEHMSGGAAGGGSSGAAALGPAPASASPQIPAAQDGGQANAEPPIPPGKATTAGEVWVEVTQP